jgi:hypothetical protein
VYLVYCLLYLKYMINHNLERSMPE